MSLRLRDRLSLAARRRCKVLIQKYFTTFEYKRMRRRIQLKAAAANRGTRDALRKLDNEYQQGISASSHGLASSSSLHEEGTPRPSSSILNPVERLTADLQVPEVASSATLIRIRESTVNQHQGRTTVYTSKRAKICATGSRINHEIEEELDDLVTSFRSGAVAGSHEITPLDSRSIANGP